MSDTPRWTRTFSSASSFSDDLGSLGLEVTQAGSERYQE